MAAASRPILIFDGECGICRASVSRVRAWDRDAALDYLPFQDARAQQLGIALPALAAAMHLVLPDGRVFVGADAVPELGRLLPGRSWWTWIFALPGVRAAARRAYRVVAERRHCAVRGLPAAHGAE